MGYYRDSSVNPFTKTAYAASSLPVQESAKGDTSTCLFLCTFADITGTNKRVCQSS